MSSSQSSAEVRIAHHAASTPEVARFDAAGEFLLLAGWVTVATTCSFP